MIPRLLDHIAACGYDYTLRDLYRDQEACIKSGFKDSLHGLRLAIDIAIFDKNNKETYLTKTEDYAFAGVYWEWLGGTWGGRFSKPDGNHFSVTYMGRK